MLMYIFKPLVFAGGTLSFHAPGGASQVGDFVHVAVYSWPDLESFNSQASPVKQTNVVFDLAFDLISPERALASHPQSPLLGGEVRVVLEDAASLQGMKDAKNAAINAARLKANQSFFMFAGKQIAVDQLSRGDIDAAHGTILMLQTMPPGWPGGWKAMDNTYVSIPDVATWGQFYGAMVAQGMTNFAHAQTLKAQLAAATTPEEVEALPNW